MRFLLLGLGRLWLRSLRVHWSFPSAPGRMLSGRTGSGPLPDSALPAQAVILLWHEHLPACMRAFSRRGIHVLISLSADGAWAAETCASMGYRVHRGSSSRGSLGGMRALARALEGGNAKAGMALDGPRGPRRAVKAGSLWLARTAGVPVVPVWVEAAMAIRLDSWDRCLIPLPFSRIEVRLGAPFHPESEAEIAAAMAGLETGPARPAPAPAGRPSAG